MRRPKAKKKERMEKLMYAVERGNTEMIELLKNNNIQEAYNKIKEAN